MTLSTVPHPAIAGSLPDGRRIVDVLKYVNHDYYINDNHQVVSPHVIYAPIDPEAYSQPIIQPTTIVKHSNAGPRSTWWQNLINYWRRSDITGEAHFQVPLNGPMIQAMPLNRRADCNYKANPFAISYETEDYGYPSLPNTPWTISQLGHMISVDMAICVTYGVWCTAPAYWNDTGIGFHSQFPEWSSYVGKTCPGAARIRQMDYIRGEVAKQLAAFSRVTGWQCGQKGFL